MREEQPKVNDYTTPLFKESGGFVPILDEVDTGKLDIFVRSFLEFESKRITKEEFLNRFELRQEDVNLPRSEETVGPSSVASIRQDLLDSRRVEIGKRLKGNMSAWLAIIDFDRVLDKDIEIILKFKNGVLTKKEYLVWVNSVYREVRQEVKSAGVLDERQKYIYEAFHPRWRFSGLLDTSMYPYLK